MTRSSRQSLWKHAAYFAFDFLMEGEEQRGGRMGYPSPITPFLPLSATPRARVYYSVFVEFDSRCAIRIPRGIRRRVSLWVDLCHGQMCYGGFAVILETRTTKLPNFWGSLVFSVLNWSFGIPQNCVQNRNEVPKGKCQAQNECITLSVFRLIT